MGLTVDGPGAASLAAMYCALSVLGLGALILAAPSLLEVIKWLGVGYLAWLGLRALRSAARGAAPLQAPALRARPLTLFRQSFVLQGSNPKAVLYFCTLLGVFAADAEGAASRIASCVCSTRSPAPRSWPPPARWRRPRCAIAEGRRYSSGASW